MKKNGFTLVELLAVIAILAILVIIALPNVMGMFNTAKKNSFITECKTIYGVAMEEWINDSMFETSTRTYSRCATCTGKSLSLSGRNNLDYIIEIDKSGCVTKYYATDGTYQYKFEDGCLKKEDIDDPGEVAELQNYERIGIEEDTISIPDDDRLATLNTGSSINTAMKRLSGQENPSNTTANETILAFKKWTGNKLPNGVVTETVSISSSDTPVYMWFDNGTIYYYSDTKNIYLNPTSSYLFNELNKLTDISGLYNLNTSKVTNMNNMFSGCSSITSLDLTHFDTSKVTSMQSMFDGMTKLENLNISNFNTANVTTMRFMFRSCSSLTSLNVSSFNTSKVTNMQSMFSSMPKLESLDLSNFDTSRVTTMLSMFYNDAKLTSLDLSSFNTSNVTEMGSMFRNCTGLVSLNVSSFNTSKVTNMSQMFWQCSKLESLDITNFDTSNVTSMSLMLSQVGSLKTIDLSHFNTSKVTNFQWFIRWNNFTELDLSSFDTSRATNMESMFDGNSKATVIYVSNKWNTSKVTSSEYMVRGLNKIVGGNGTVYSDAHMDVEYARVDEVGSPGYFTLKNP